MFLGVFLARYHYTGPPLIIFRHSQSPHTAYQAYALSHVFSMLPDQGYLPPANRHTVSPSPDLSDRERGYISAQTLSSNSRARAATRDGPYQHRRQSQEKGKSPQVKVKPYWYQLIFAKNIYFMGHPYI